MTTGFLDFDELYADMKAENDGMWGDATDSETALFAMLPRRPMPTGLLKYGRSVVIDNGTGNQYTEGTQAFQASQKTAKIHPEAKLAYFEDSITIDDQTIDALSRTGGAGGWLAAEQQAALNRLARAVELAICAASNANGFISIQEWINENNTVAGINRNNYARFEPAIDTAQAARTLAVSVLDGGATGLVNTHRGKFNINLTSPTLHDYYGGLSTGVVTRSQFINQEGMQPYQRVIGGVGVGNLQDAVHTYKSAPVVRVPDYATDRWDLVNLNPDTLYIVEGRKPTWSEWRRVGGTMVADVTCAYQLWLHNPYKNAAGILQLKNS